MILIPRNIQALARTVNNSIKHNTVSTTMAFYLTVYTNPCGWSGRICFPADLSVIDYEGFYLKPSTSLNTSGGALGVRT